MMTELRKLSNDGFLLKAGKSQLWCFVFFFFFVHQRSGTQFQMLEYQDVYQDNAP